MALAPDVTEAVVKMEILLFTGKEKLKTPKRQLVKITGRNPNASQVEPGLAADKQIAGTVCSRDCSDAVSRWEATDTHKGQYPSEADRT